MYKYTFVFELKFALIFQDIAEPLMDLQLAMKEVEESKTFRTAMGMLLIIGNTLNGTNVCQSAFFVFMYIQECVLQCVCAHMCLYISMYAV